MPAFAGMTDFTTHGEVFQTSDINYDEEYFSTKFTKHTKVRASRDLNNNSQWSIFRLKSFALLTPTSRNQ